MLMAEVSVTLKFYLVSWFPLVVRWLYYQSGPSKKVFRQKKNDKFTCRAWLALSFMHPLAFLGYD